jgi:hypothetical protein
MNSRHATTAASVSIASRLLSMLVTLALVAGLAAATPAAVWAEEAGTQSDPQFVTTWDTNKITGTTIWLQFRGEVEVDVDWGDGTVTKGVTRSVSRTYTAEGHLHGRRHGHLRWLRPPIRDRQQPCADVRR